MRCTKAITRLPGPNFADGITTANLGKPDYELAQKQHAQYCGVLSQLGVAVEVLPADPRFPDGCFVEDTAIVTERGVIITNPGDSARSGETAAIGVALGLASSPTVVARFEAPATLDGGDVLRIDDTFIIGLSNRTNVAGAEQLSATLRQLDFAAQTIRIPENLLHLKTGVSFVGQNTLIIWPSLAHEAAFAQFNKVIPDDEERYAANTLCVNGTVIVPASFPDVSRSLRDFGIPVVETPMSEFQKMDGGLTCLSLLF